MQVMLCFCFFLFIFTPTTVKCRYQVTSSRQPVVAAPGDDVILQCLVEPQLDMVDMTVEWSRPGAKHRTKVMEYVHLYRDNREVLDMKSLLYQGRTALLADGLRHSNISLIITNVTTADEGEYKCFVPKLHGNIKSSTVHLIIDQNSSKTTSETQLYPEATRQNDLNGGVSCSSSFTPLVVVFIAGTFVIV